jgi:anti-sigma regulatory factor (Ser/Thr protein kinase)
LTLVPGPRGVRDARRWVASVCLDIGRPELVECAELGVSELVTNAVLHGADPIQVRVRGTREHPRVEVRDASRERPILPGPLGLDPDDDLLLTFGRGLSIVARSSDAWGAEIEADGKVVWFAPAAELAEDDGVEGIINGPSAGDTPPVVDDPVDVRVLGVPLRLYVGFQQHFRELRREVRLLAIAHEDHYPLAKSLSDLFGTLERQLRDGIGLTDLEGALAHQAEIADLSVTMPREAATTLRSFVDLLDVADRFCRQERLLSLARTDEQRAFQRWFLGEYIRQAAGAQPEPWVEPQGQVALHAAH